MKNNRITFIGATNNTSARESKPGECSLVINLERHNSTLRPSTPHSFAGGVANNNRKMCYIHSCAGEQHVITTDGTTLYYEANIVDGQLVSVNKKLTALLCPMNDINSLGNTLVITTSQQNIYIVYRKDGYKVLGNRPQMPIIQLKERLINYYYHTFPEVKFDAHITELSEENHDFFYNHIVPPIYKYREEAHKNFEFFEPVLVRYALRLFDGSHILPSPPVLINLGNYKQFMEEQYQVLNYYANTNKSVLTTRHTSWCGMGIEYVAHSIELDEWKDIVLGIDIFVSKEVSVIEDRLIDDYSYYENREDGSQFVYRYKVPMRDNKAIEHDILNESVFYYFSTLNIEDIVMETPTLIRHEINPEEIIFRSLLEVDTTSLVTIGAEHSFVYNNRLHLADLYYRYLPGYAPILFCAGDEDNNENALIYMRTKIMQSDGGFEETTAMATVHDFNMLLSPIISYPDANACSMEIGIRFQGYEYKKRLILKAVDNENRASFVSPNAVYMDVNDWYKTAITNENISDFPSATSSIVLKQHNRMIVSASNNPFSFPDELSYHISNGTINGMASATTALSQGQFGEYPLYIFTTEGMWSMQAGTGDVCYSRCTPLNNECTNDKSFIIPTERAVIYLSGKNISAISGSQGKVILPLDEIQPDNFNSSLPQLLPTFSAAGKDTTSIIDYLNDNTNAIYDLKKNNLILYNGNYPYCWMLHIPSGHLYRWEGAILSIASNGETLFAQNNQGIIYKLDSEIESIQDIHLITKPLQFMPDFYSRLRQVVWRMQASHSILWLSVLASHEPDGTYKVIHRSRYEGYISGHLSLRLFSAPYKFYRLALSGTVTPDATIDGADVAYEIVEHNKLR